MFDVSKVKERSEFTYWFERLSGDKWTVVANNEARESVGILTETSDDVNVHIGNSDIDADSHEEMMFSIKEEFAAFIECRPEYMVGRHIDNRLISASPVNEETMLEMRDMYNTLIAGIYYLTYDDEKAEKLTKRCLNWLSNTDFYIAPGSTVYHDAEPCGLLRHSLKVTDKMTELLALPSFSMVNYHEAILTALVHDWCKIDFYEQYMKNVKDETTGVWNKVPSYKCKGSSLPFGHGVTSMFIAQKFFKLSTEQALSVRWHMARWNAADKELVDLCNAEETYPMIHLLQFADQLASANY
ncbi:MAG: hypothetical protein NC320_03110 [Clostridium sp.]|nr:hypothetical protein [Clostridium sp.]